MKKQYRPLLLDHAILGSAEDTIRSRILRGFFELIGYSSEMDTETSMERAEEILLEMLRSAEPTGIVLPNDTLGIGGTIRLQHVENTIGFPKSLTDRLVEATRRAYVSASSDDPSIRDVIINIKNTSLKKPTTLWHRFPTEVTSKNQLRGFRNIFYTTYFKPVSEGEKARPILVKGRRNILNEAITGAYEDIADPVQAPKSTASSEPATATTPEPAPEPATATAPEPAPEPAPRPSTEPAPRPSTEPSTEPASRPSTEPAPRPSTEPSTEPATVTAPSKEEPALVFLRELTSTLGITVADDGTLRTEDATPRPSLLTIAYQTERGPLLSQYPDMILPGDVDVTLVVVSEKLGKQMATSKEAPTQGDIDVIRNELKALDPKQGKVGVLREHLKSITEYLLVSRPFKPHARNTYLYASNSPLTSGYPMKPLRTLKVK